MTDVQLIQVFP
jgi:hypothetical protein